MYKPVEQTDTTKPSKMGPDRKTEEDPEGDSSSERDLVMPQMVVAMGDESSDEEANDEEQEEMGPQGDGYMLLPDADQDEPVENEIMDGEFPTNPSNHHHHQQQQQQQQQQLPELPPHLAKLMPSEAVPPDPSTVVSFTDTTKSLEERRQVMAADDEIRKAMAGVSLPGMAVPPWARVQGNKEWKEQLTKMIDGKDERKQDKCGPSSKDRKT